MARFRPRFRHYQRGHIRPPRAPPSTPGTAGGIESGSPDLGFAAFRLTIDVASGRITVARPSWWSGPVVEGAANQLTSQPPAGLVRV
jgi:hypothetical protein